MGVESGGGGYESKTKRETSPNFDIQCLFLDTFKFNIFRHFLDKMADTREETKS